MSCVRVEISERKFIDVWPAEGMIHVWVRDERFRTLSVLTTGHVDELILALAAARVELSKARPR